MNINSTGNRARVILIALIMAVVVTALFLVLKATIVLSISYIFALLGIILFGAGNLYILSNFKSYPWFAAYPATIWRYLILQLLLSALFVVCDKLFSFSLPGKWFVLFHLFLLAFFAIMLILQKGGRSIIENREQDIRTKTAAFRLLVADAESLLRKFPQYENDLNQVAEALRYSDPMSDASLALYEEQIQRGLLALNNLEGDGLTAIPEKCVELLRQIADRNSRAKILK